MGDVSVARAELMRRLSRDKAMEMPKFVISTIFTVRQTTRLNECGSINNYAEKTVESVMV